MKYHVDLSQAINYSTHIASDLMKKRQISNPVQFLHPSLKMIHNDIYLPDSAQIHDMKQGTQLIRKAIKENWTIVVYSDYDTDGITSNTIMYSLLKQLGAKHVIPYCPSRIYDGYGLNMHESRKIISQGAKLVITTDNGISCVQEAMYLRQHHVNVIITDHHNWQVIKALTTNKLDRKKVNYILHHDISVVAIDKPSQAKDIKQFHKLGIKVISKANLSKNYKHVATLSKHSVYRLDTVIAYKAIPDANYIIMPNCPFDKFHFDGFCGAGIAFMIACYMLKRVATEYLDIACLGTVADSVPLLQEDRVIVKYGLEEIRKGRRKGIRALAKVAGMKLNTMSSTDLSFSIIPRLNTLGRIETATSNANLGRKLLLAK